MGARRGGCLVLIVNLPPAVVATGLSTLAVGVVARQVATRAMKPTHTVDIEPETGTCPTP